MNVPHRFVGRLVYDVPLRGGLAFSKSGPLNTVVGGWGIGAV